MAISGGAGRPRRRGAGAVRQPLPGGPDGRRGFLGLATLVVGNWRPAGVRVRCRRCSATSRASRLRTSPRSWCWRCCSSPRSALFVAALLAIIRQQWIPVFGFLILAVACGWIYLIASPPEQPVRVHHAVPRDADRRVGTRPGPATARPRPASRGARGCRSDARAGRARAPHRRRCCTTTSTAGCGRRRCSSWPTRSAGRCRRRSESALQAWFTRGAETKRPAAVPRDVRAHARRDADAEARRAGRRRGGRRPRRRRRRVRRGPLRARAAQSGDSRSQAAIEAVAAGFRRGERRRAAAGHPISASTSICCAMRTADRSLEIARLVDALRRPTSRRWWRSTSPAPRPGSRRRCTPRRWRSPASTTST